MRNPYPLKNRCAADTLDPSGQFMCPPQIMRIVSLPVSRYLSLYRFLPHIDRILMLALRHKRESGYKGL